MPHYCKLKTRVREHCRNIRIGLETHSVSAHFKSHHNQNPTGIKFWDIERVKKWWRGEHLDKKLNQREVYWIFQLNTLTPSV